jgi:photosystem II stability/assembly factor-like uncharacterized protein
MGFLPGCQTKKADTLPEKTIDPYGRSEVWHFVGAGGGGAMFNPAVSPHDPKMAFVSCDMTGSFVTFNGGESWRMFNLGSPVNLYAFDPLDSNVVYANSVALFKSNDKGITWKVFYPAPSEISGLVSKGDHGEEILVTRDSSNREVLALTIDPSDSKKLYAVITINQSTSLYISDDGGEQWKQEKELEGNIKKIFIDPSSPTDNRTIYLASDKGITQKVNGNWSNNSGPAGVSSLTEFSGGFDKIQQKYFIYAISGKSYFNPKGDRSGIYITDNGGMTWVNREDGLLSCGLKGVDLPEWRTVATSAFHPGVVYVSYNGLKIHKDTSLIGVAKSEDYGITWKLVWKDVLTKTGPTPSANFSKDMLNERFGPSWAENPFGIGVSPADPEICFATDFGRTVKTSDGGDTWEQVYSKNINNIGWTSRGLEVTTGYTVVFDPFDTNHVFIALTDIGLFESKDGTATWMSATKDNGVPSNWANTCYWFQYDPEVKGKAWAVMSGTHDLPRPKMFRRNGISGYKGGVLITENNGKTWQPSSSDIGEAAMTHILLDRESSKEARTLYACAFGKGVYKSADGGKTWVQKNKGIDIKEPFAWQIVQREKDDALFLIISRRSEDGSIGNENDGAVYKSVDGAENWTKISLPEGTNAPTSLVIDEQNQNRLILSAWGRKTQGRFTPDIGGGIFVSDDEGKTWKQVMDKDQHIGAITLDTRNKRLYACGFNSSAYYSEDGAETWNRIKGYNFKWGQRVEPDPRDLDKIFILTFGGGVWYGPAKGE